MSRLPLPCALATAAVLALAGPASAKTTWLCRPDRVPSPCSSSLTAGAVNAAGRVTRVEHTSVDRDRGIDCFYLYPTVSGQSTLNATLRIDPEQRAIARFQASRFSQHCRVWAPMYRQLTLAGIFDPSKITAKARAVAYDSAVAGWRDYLAHHNHGRGFVLIGHSQGSFVLRTLIAREIDDRPAVRRRMVSALLLGGNVLVRSGSDLGGDFRHVPACRSASQLGCVVAYSMFNATPPADARFGRSPTKGEQVLCTNPAALGGGTGTLRTYTPTTRFPGTLGIAVNDFIGELPKIPTPWLIPPGRYTAHCSRAGGASVLMVGAHAGARVAKPSPAPTWGLHLGDVNFALGNLVDLVGRQAAAYAQRP
jgi:hypothetical protein